VEASQPVLPKDVPVPDPSVLGWVLKALEEVRVPPHRGRTAAHIVLGVGDAGLAVADVREWAPRARGAHLDANSMPAARRACANFFFVASCPGSGSGSGSVAERILATVGPSHSRLAHLARPMIVSPVFGPPSSHVASTRT
jgi:hypothetical protein